MTTLAGTFLGILVIALPFAIWMNTKQGKKWLNSL